MREGPVLARGPAPNVWPMPSVVVRRLARRVGVAAHFLPAEPAGAVIGLVALAAMAHPAFLVVALALLAGMRIGIGAAARIAAAAPAVELGIVGVGMSCGHGARPWRRSH